MKIENLKITVISGAGLSQESGIPTYRGPDGVYTKIQEEMGISIEKLVSLDTILTNPDLFWKYWNKLSMQSASAQPNAAHLLLESLSVKCKSYMEITQNVDGLSRSAGTSPERIIELHGSACSFSCMQCGHKWRMDQFSIKSPYPICNNCSKGAENPTVRPDVILFGECIDVTLQKRAIEHISKSDVLVIIGTELHFYYLLEMVAEARKNGISIFIINPEFNDFITQVDSLFGVSDDISKNKPIYIQLPASLGLEELIDRLEK